jgi:hypothetical protein
MTEVKDECYCNNCKGPRSKDDAKCKICGSDKKLICVTISESFSVHELVKGTVTEEGSRKPAMKFLTGDSFSGKEGVWRNRGYTVDRKNDVYKEIVTDKVTGVIIHKCEEPLSQHRGHGSAKKSNVAVQENEEP